MSNTPSSKNKGGAPLGNTNALKHGYYSRVFREKRKQQIAELAAQYARVPSYTNMVILQMAMSASYRQQHLFEAILKINENIHSPDGGEVVPRLCRK